MAAVLDFPTTFFSQADRVFGFGSPCFYHRTRTRMPVGDLRQIQARLNIFRFHVTRLVRGMRLNRKTSSFGSTLMSTAAPRRWLACYVPVGAAFRPGAERRYR